MAQHVVAGQCGSDLAREQPLVRRFGLAVAQRQTLTLAQATLDIGQRALQVGRDGRAKALQVLVHAKHHLRLVLQLADLVVDLLE